MTATKRIINYLEISSSVYLCLIILSIATLIGINFRFVYYIDFHLFSLSGQQGLTNAQIFSIYHQLVNYLHPLYFGKFPISDPNLVSAVSIKHFIEVKEVFNIIWLAGAGGIIGLSANFITCKRNNLVIYKFYKYSAIFYISIITIFLFFLLVFFNQTFTLFHQIVFRNDDWMFNDGIIHLLPAEFFMHMGIVIGLLIIGYSFTCLFIYFNVRRKYSK